MVNDVELGLGERFSAGFDIIIGMPNDDGVLLISLKTMLWQSTLKLVQMTPLRYQ